jgi:hypothetical protein
MSEETTYRYLKVEEQERFILMMYQALSLVGENIEVTARLERDIAHQFALPDIGQLRAEQLDEVEAWTMTVWTLDELERGMKQVYDRHHETLQELHQLYVQVNRQRALQAKRFPKVLACALALLLGLQTTFAFALRAPTVNIQPPVTQDVDWTTALSFTVPLNEEEVKSWLADYPAAVPYADRIQKVERTSYVDYPAEFVVAVLSDTSLLISAQVSSTKAIKLVTEDGVQDLSPILPPVALNSLTTIAAPESSVDDCQNCITNCFYHAQQVFNGEAQAAGATFVAASVACIALAGKLPWLALGCVAAALLKFTADMDAAQRRHLQAKFQCGNSCRRPNGTSCLARER